MMGGAEIPPRAAGLVIASATIWGTVAIVVKVLVETIDPAVIAFIRLALGGVLITTVLLLRRSSRGILANYRLILFGGVGMALNYLLYTIGLQYTLASAAAMVVQSEVVFLVTLSVILLGESFGPRRIAGMVLALLGVVIISWNGQELSTLFASEYFLGNVIVFFAGFFWAIYAYSQKRLTGEQDILASLSPIMLISSAILLPLALPELGSLTTLDPGEVVALLYLGLICTGVSYMSLAEGLKRINASITGVLTTVMPVTSVILAYLLLKEVLTAYMIVGAALDICGILLVVTSRE